MTIAIISMRRATGPFRSTASATATSATHNDDCSATNSNYACPDQGDGPGREGRTRHLAQPGFNSRFTHSNNTAVGDGVNSGGYIFNAPDDDYLKNYVGRVDYNLNRNMKMFARFTVARENALRLRTHWRRPGDQSLLDRSYTFVVGHDWVIGHNKTNRVFAGRDSSEVQLP